MSVVTLYQDLLEIKLSGMKWVTASGYTSYTFNSNEEAAKTAVRIVANYLRGRATKYREDAAQALVSRDTEMHDERILQATLIEREVRKLEEDLQKE